MATCPLGAAEAVSPSAPAPPHPAPASPESSSPRNTLTFPNVLITGADQVWAGEGGEMD